MSILSIIRECERPGSTFESPDSVGAGKVFRLAIATDFDVVVLGLVLEDVACEGVAGEVGVELVAGGG